MESNTIEMLFRNFCVVPGTLLMLKHAYLQASLGIQQRHHMWYTTTSKSNLSVYISVTGTEVITNPSEERNVRITGPQEFTYDFIPYGERSHCSYSIRLRLVADHIHIQTLQVGGISWLISWQYHQNTSAVWVRDDCPAATQRSYNKTLFLWAGYRGFWFIQIVDPKVLNT